MPDTAPSNVHVNQLLSAYALAYPVRNLIADQVFPVIPVGKQSDLYSIVDKADWLRLEDTRRAPLERPKQVTMSVSSDSYNARNYALGGKSSHEEQANADDPIRPLQRGVGRVKTALSIDFEVRVQLKCATGVGSSTSLSGTTAWDDYANSDPITNVRVARQAIHKTTGFMPNVAVIGQKAWEVVKYHPDIVGAVFNGGGGGGTVSLEGFKNFLEVDKVLVGRTVYNSAAQGQAGSFTDVWSTHLYLMYVEPDPGIDTPTFGASFNWKGPKLGDGQPGNWMVKTKEDDEASCTKFWTGYYQDEKIIAPELGFQIRTGIL